MCTCSYSVAPLQLAMQYCMVVMVVKAMYILQYNCIHNHKWDCIIIIIFYWVQA